MHRSFLTSIAIMTTAAGICLSSGTDAIRLHPLVAYGLPNDVDLAKIAFDRRIKERFPVGSSAADIERTLTADGFGPARVYKNDRYVTLTRAAGFGVDEIITVSWSSSQNRLITVSGIYTVMGL